MPRRSNSPHAARSAVPAVNTRASAAGTTRYAERFASGFVPDFYRASRAGLTLSSMAFGTYLGDSDDATDDLYAGSAREALSCGMNVVDTAINYRCQRSERVIGRVLQELMGDGVVRRDEVVLCTKAGYVPMDGAPPESRQSYEQYLRTEYFDSGVLRPEDLVGGGHSIAPAFLENQLRRSMRNLGVQSIDYFYIHNPEHQLTAITPAELSTRLRAAFEMLENLVAEGAIGAYGCATWNGLRLPAGSNGHLSLYELAALAGEVAGTDHHFRIAQLPVNLSMSEAVRVSTQRGTRGRLVHVVDAAAELGIDLVVSAPLLQGQLAEGMPDQVREMFPGATDAQRALSFARGVPAAVTVAVGTRTVAHVRENLAGVRG